MSKKQQDSLKKVIFLVLILMLVILSITLITAMLDIFQSVPEDEEYSINVVINPEQVKENEKNEELEKLKTMSERNRIEYYISQFIKDVEEGNIEEAYSVLNTEFKKNYFKTIKDFKEYAETKFTKMMDIDYTNFERNGQIYVSWLKLTDAINGDKNSGIEMNFVVKENDFNEYELSFSVK